MKTEAINRKVADPYAEALMALAEEQNLVEAINTDVQAIISAVSNSPELNHFVASPVMPDALKKQVLGQVLGGLQPLTLNFVGLLVDRRRVAFVLDVCTQFQALYRQKKNIALAEITTATALSDEQTATLRQKVMDLTGAESVELEITVDPSLIGGVSIKVGSQIIDASIRGQLRRISSRLLASV
jgi:F-type H+-transporting ATPase subunit delta